MPVTAELKTLQHAIDGLKNAVRSVQGAYGDVPAVARLLNDVERLNLDAADIHGLTPPSPTPVAATSSVHLSDEPYDASMWKDDADDEGLGGYHGTSR